MQPSTSEPRRSSSNLASSSRKYAQTAGESNSNSCANFTRRGNARLHVSHSSRPTRRASFSPAIVSGVAMSSVGRVPKLSAASLTAGSMPMTGTLNAPRSSDIAALVAVLQATTTASAPRETKNPTASRLSCTIWALLFVP